MTAQDWNPERYAANARFVSDLGQPVLALLAPQPGERILDLGCGDGALTQKLVEYGCETVGVDASPEFIQAARERGLDARVMDGQQLDFDNEFDAAFSNAAMHWMKRADDVLAGVRRALKARGRFVGEFGGGDNVATIRAALHATLERRGVSAHAVDPWYFPTADEYASKLRAHDFAVHSIELFPRPTPLPGDMVAWLRTFGESFLAALPEPARVDFFEEVREALRPDLCDADGNWSADYVRLRFAAALN